MKLDSLLGILTILLQKDRVTTPKLAEKFEVSRRTIGRDIDALCQAGIPIIIMATGQQHLLIKMQNQAVTCRFIHYCWFFHRPFYGNPVKEWGIVANYHSKKVNAVAL